MYSLVLVFSPALMTSPHLFEGAPKPSIGQFSPTEGQTKTAEAKAKVFGITWPAIGFFVNEEGVHRVFHGFAARQFLVMMRKKFRGINERVDQKHESPLPEYFTNRLRNSAETCSNLPNRRDFVRLRLPSFA
jgi:hypothetical protein